MAAPDDIDAFPFTGLTGRPTGPVVRALGTIFPGVSDVQRQVGPYAAAWRAQNQLALTGGHRRWVALGDSMTQGIGASDPGRGWIGQLTERLPEPVDVINLSQSGGRVEDLLATQIPAWRALAPSPHGEIITVLIGSNDVLSPRHRNLLPEGFAELLEALPPTAIVSAIPSPAGPARRANELVRAAAEAGRVRAVYPTSFDPGAWRGKLAADRFHPNDAGYTMIADLFCDAVSAALAQLSQARSM